MIQLSGKAFQQDFGAWLFGGSVRTTKKSKQLDNLLSGVKQDTLQSERCKLGVLIQPWFGFIVVNDASVADDKFQFQSQFRAAGK